MFARLFLAALVPAAIAVAGFGVASAQYPPPVGNCVVTASATAVQAGGGNVDIQVTVRDLNGAPVPGETVTFSIVSQPGSSGSVAPSSATTDSSGVASTTLNTGSPAGTVEVLATAESVSCRTSVVVPSGQVAPAVILPNTGSGPGGAGALGAEIALALVLGGIVLAVVGIRRRSA
jgi:hypothetical protein